MLWIGTEYGRVFRWKTDTGDLEEARGHLGAMKLRGGIQKIFAEGYGGGALLLTRSGQLYYGSGGTTGVRPREVRAARNLGIRVLSWVVVGERGKRELVAVTGGIDGEVWALHLDQARKKDTVMKLWTTPEQERIDGISVERVAEKFVAFVATLSKLYLFSGADSLAGVFSENPQICEHMTKDDAAENTQFGSPTAYPLPFELQFMSGVRSSSAAGRKFVWAQKLGIVYAQLAVQRSQTAGARRIVIDVADRGIIQWKRLKNDSGSAAPMACNLSSFHVLVLYPSLLLVYSSISGAYICEVPLWRPTGSGSLSREIPLLRSPAAGFARDAVADVLWIFTSNNEIARLDVSSSAERLYAWKVAKQCDNLELALALAPLSESGESRTTGSRGREQVLLSQAERFASEGDHQSAVRLYAKTSYPVERVCLSIISEFEKVNERKMKLLLIEYLVRKLDNIPDNQFSQRTIISMILVELYASVLSKIDRDIPRKNSGSIHTDFRYFLSDHHKEIHLPSAVKILSSHQCLEEALYLSMLQENAVSAIDICILQKSYKGAVDVARAPFLRTKGKERNMADILAYMTPPIAAFEPKKLADVWMETSLAGNQKLDDLLLLTTLSSVVRIADWKNRNLCDASFQAYSAATNYISFILDRPQNRAEMLTMTFSNSSKDASTSEAHGSEAHKAEAYEALAVKTLVENLVLCLFELHNYVDDEAAALEAFDRLSIVNRKLLFLVLGCSHRAHFMRLRVQVYAALGMYEQAVTLALKIDHDLAELIVSSIPSDMIDRPRHRKLWSDIANNSEDPVTLLPRSNGILRIEDILQIIPDFDCVSSGIQSRVISSIIDNKEGAKGAKLSSQATMQSIERLRLEVEQLNQWREGMREPRIKGVTKFPCGHRLSGKFYESCVICGFSAIDSIDVPISRSLAL
eukprot:Plantae.Rhodophyta-Hildenbrandia_rubra.ctg4852.p1 GENE.Plantae.Rhodophyta-Hildenbrandia_rubra.ctg4852~~Plantae.Rhodophyta-Hildenbrandia_rubra.ctg4852.p1  ORF type:complete len:922 (-),score=139.18 Plantae.Rhodophyta-Hildenbrandia_rubra.ctg4852:1553-4318(-)